MSKEFTEDIFRNEYLELNKTLKEICVEYSKTIGSLNKKVIKLKLKKNSEQKYYSKFINHTNLRKKGIYKPADIKKFIYTKYINENLRVVEVASLLETSEISITRLLRRLKITKDRELYQDLMEETSLKRYGARSSLSSTEIKEKVAKTNMERYGFKNVFSNRDIQAKLQKTNLEKYGNTNSVQNKEIQEKIKKDNLKKYGVEHNISRPEVREKIKSTMLKKLGVATPFESQEIQDKIVAKNLINIGVEYPTCSKEFFLKSWETKKSRGTCNTSKPEEDLYKLLKEVFPETLITRNYNTDKRYPFACDFYLPEFDLFIELQGSWTHGKEPYNDTNLPLKWEVKSEFSKYYRNAVEVFTVKDTLKRKTASENSLNYLEIWDSDLKKGTEWLVFLLLKQGLPIHHTEKELRGEFGRLSKSEGNYLATPRDNISVKTFQNHLYKEERRLWNIPRIREKLVENRLKYLNKDLFELSNQSLLSGFKISGIHTGYSFFSPLWIKAFIEEYDIQSIYDPCAGWGHRLLGSIDVDYLGNEINPDTYLGLENLKDYFDLKNVTLSMEKAESFTPDRRVDAVFTCPPYFDTELYGGDESSTVLYREYDNWLNNWWGAVIDNALKVTTKYFAFIINEKYKNDMLEKCLEKGLSLLKVEKISSPRNHFQRTSSNSFKGESLVVLTV